MDIWAIPLMIVALIICMIGITAVWKWNKVNVVAIGQDGSIPAEIEEHPFTLNPIIWVALVASFFIGIVIFYYAASS